MCNNLRRWALVFPLIRGDVVGAVGNDVSHLSTGVENSGGRLGDRWPVVFCTKLEARVVELFLDSLREWLVLLLLLLPCD